jgi:hypothetical protein
MGTQFLEGGVGVLGKENCVLPAFYNTIFVLPSHNL